MRAPTTATILRGGLGSTNAQRELLNPKQRAARELTYSSRGAECVRDLATLWDIWTDKDQISAGLLRDSPVLSRALPWSTIATAVQSTGFRLTRRQQNQTVTIRPCLRDSRLTQPVGPAGFLRYSLVLFYALPCWTIATAVWPQASPTGSGSYKFDPLLKIVAVPPARPYGIAGRARRGDQFAGRNIQMVG